MGNPARWGIRRERGGEIVREGAKFYTDRESKTQSEHITKRKNDVVSLNFLVYSLNFLSFDDNRNMDNLNYL